MGKGQGNLNADTRMDKIRTNKLFKQSFGLEPNLELVFDRKIRGNVSINCKLNVEDTSSFL